MTYLYPALRSSSHAIDMLSRGHDDDTAAHDQPPPHMGGAWLHSGILAETSPAEARFGIPASMRHVHEEEKNSEIEEIHHMEKWVINSLSGLDERGW